MEPRRITFTATLTAALVVALLSPTAHACAAGSLTLSDFVGFDKDSGGYWVLSGNVERADDGVLGRTRLTVVHVRDGQIVETLPIYRAQVREALPPKLLGREAAIIHLGHTPLLALAKQLLKDRETHPGLSLKAAGLECRVTPDDEDATRRCSANLKSPAVLVSLRGRAGTTQEQMFQLPKGTLGWHSIEPKEVDARVSPNGTQVVLTVRASNSGSFHQSDLHQAFVMSLRAECLGAGAPSDCTRAGRNPRFNGAAYCAERMRPCESAHGALACAEGLKCLALPDGARCIE